MIEHILEYKCKVNDNNMLFKDVDTLQYYLIIPFRKMDYRFKELSHKYNYILQDKGSFEPRWRLFILVEEDIKTRLSLDPLSMKVNEITEEEAFEYILKGT